MPAACADTRVIETPAMPLRSDLTAGASRPWIAPASGRTLGVIRKALRDVSSSARLPGECLLGQRVAGVQDQRLTLHLGLADLTIQVRAGSRIEHMDPAVT